MRTTNNEGAKKKSTLLASNPVMRRLDKVDEYTDDNAATFGGITGKTIFFLLFSVVGIFLQLILGKYLAGGQLFNLNIKGFEVSLYMYEIFALLGATLLAIVFQLLAFFARGTTPVTGALYCVTQGYIISFLVFKVLRGFEYLGFAVPLYRLPHSLHTADGSRAASEFCPEHRVRCDFHHHRRAFPDLRLQHD